MHRHVLVAFLKAGVLLGVVEVVSVDDGGPLHLLLGHHTRQKAPSNRDMTSEGAFLVNISALCGFSWAS